MRLEDDKAELQGQLAAEQPSGEGYDREIQRLRSDNMDDKASDQLGADGESQTLCRTLMTMAQELDDKDANI